MPEISNSENPYATPTVDPILPEDNPTKELDLATRRERFCAEIIDVSIIFIAQMGTAYLVRKFLREAPDKTLMGLLGSMVFLIAHSWLLATRGQTVGKLLMGTKIVRLDGQKPSLLRLLGLRYAPFWAATYIPTAGGWISLINYLFIFRENRRCLHDLLAGTKVVKIGRLVREMPQPRLMPHRNAAHAAHVLSQVLLEDLDLVSSEIPYDSRWQEDLNISPENFAAFCRKLAGHFETLTLHELEKCATYGDLLRLLGIPQIKRFR